MLQYSETQVSMQVWQFAGICFSLFTAWVVYSAGVQCFSLKALGVMQMYQLYVEHIQMIRTCIQSCGKRLHPPLCNISISITFN